MYMYFLGGQLTFERFVCGLRLKRSSRCILTPTFTPTDSSFSIDPQVWCVSVCVCVVVTNFKAPYNCRGQFQWTFLIARHNHMMIAIMHTCYHHTPIHQPSLSYGTRFIPNDFCKAALLLACITAIFIAANRHILFCMPPC